MQRRERRLDNEEERNRWSEGSKGGCEPEKLLLTHAAAHLGCEEIDGPFLICYVRFLYSFFFFLNQICHVFVLTHIPKVKVSSGENYLFHSQHGSTFSNYPSIL